MQTSQAERHQGAETDRLPPDLTPIRAEEFGEPEARHLLWRAGFGGTPHQIRTLAAWGPEKAVDHLLGVEAIPYEQPAADRFNADIMRPPTEEERIAYRIAQQQRNEDELARFRADRQNRERADRRQVQEVQSWWLGRMIESPRPLEEKMTLFWHGHFATSFRTIEDSYHMYLQNQFFRANALGSYTDLMYGIIRDPAMIAYLDNNDSKKGRPNENLARELMELFSLGVGNYTEQDIKEGARALTGYSFEDNEFVLRKDDHDDGPKRILGRTGNLDGEGFVSAILESPACSKFMATKLYDFFALHTSDPLFDDEAGGKRVIARMAAKLRGDKYRIKPVLRELFLSRHFYHPRVMQQRIKSPAELVVGAVRSLLTPLRDLTVLLQGMELMGQHLLFPPSVKGWDGGRAWVNTSTMYIRQNLLNYMLTGKLPHGYDATASTETYQPGPLLAPLRDRDPKAAGDPAEVAKHLLAFTVGAAPSEAVDTLRGFAQANGGISDQTVTGMLVIISAMPEYQLC